MPKGDTRQTGLTGKHTQIIEVANKYLQSLSIKGSTSLEVKKTAQLSLTANMKMTASEYGLYGTVINSSGTVREGVKWSSSNASILKVDSSGKITALKEGKATITAEVAGKKATTAITVKPETIAVTGITLDKLFTYPEIGQTITYIAKIEPENATNKKVTWSSDRPEVATVDNKGNVTGIKKGIAHITVTTEDGKKFARGVVSVKDNRTGVFFVDNQWVYLKSGKINADYTGLVYGNNRWYYMTKGVHDAKYVGLTQYNGGWWYIKNGTIDKSYTGITEYNKNSWYVRNGKVDKNYTGLAYVNNVWWYVNKGFVGKTYNGLVYHNKQWWYVSQGKLDKKFNSLFYYNNKWWYIKNGTIDKSFKGLLKYNGNLWYVVNGAVDKSYNGKVIYNGKTLTVKEGWGGKA